jgi:catechol 2,3-dioxygenase
MLKVSRPTLSHFGVYATDVDKMVHFYKTVFGLVETDRGVGKTFKAPLVFLSASPDQHHQLVIAGGRPADATFSTVMQLSFAVPSIQHLRDLKKSAEALGATRVLPLNHGNALSVYFADPEGNTVEIYIDMPFYISQPHGDPLDLTKHCCVKQKPSAEATPRSNSSKTGKPPPSNNPFHSSREST